MTAEATTQQVMDKLVIETVADMEAGENVSVLAHSHQSVDQLNREIRSLRKSSGAINNEITFNAAHRDIDVGTGDRILFDKDDKLLGVKDGQGGTITDTMRGMLTVKLDTGKKIRFSSEAYNTISHGYAMTIHRSKSVEIEKANVLVSNTFNRELSFNAMTQHKKELTLYYAKDQFHKGSPVPIMSRERAGDRKERSAPTKPLSPRR